MSHGLPPSHTHGAANLYGFGPGEAMSDLTAAQMAADGQDPGDVLAMLSSSLYDAYDMLPMNLDDDARGAMSETFQHVTLAQNTDPALVRAPSNEQSFTSPDGNPFPGSRSGTAPPGFSSQSALPGNSTLTEFTKRRNWPAKVVEELKDLLQILDANGRIRFVSPNVQDLTGYTSDEILDNLLRDFIHADDVGVFVSEMNESIASGNNMRMFYRFKTKSGSYAVFESVGHAHIAAAKFAPNPHNQSPFCQAVFVMSRLYPTKNAALLDSFLEHKMENERLRRRIAELRQEEEEADAEDAHRQWQQSQEGQSDIAASEDTMTVSIAGATPMHGSAVDHSMPPPERPSTANAALTKENLEGAVAGSRPDSLRDKMARYEGSSHADTIELLTGLNYLEGERSHGITTGNASPTLIRGDAGIPIPPDRDPRTGEKNNKKKLKTSEEYVCTDCGTLDSPEWRKGPSGPKTLCNACGLRWAKKEKKRTNSIPLPGGMGMMEE